MGGVHINVDVEKLKSVIQELENKTTFSSMSELQHAVSNSEYGSLIGISPANVYNYIKKHNIQLKTKPGKRGHGLNKMHNAGIVRISRGDKWKDDPDAQSWISGVRKYFRRLCTDVSVKDVGKSTVNKQKAGRFDKMCDRLEGGSFKAAIALMCVSCCAGVTNEVKNCEIKDCPLYQLRPWKSGDNEFAEVELDV